MEYFGISVLISIVLCYGLYSHFTQLFEVQFALTNKLLTKITNKAHVLGGIDDSGNGVCSPDCWCDSDAEITTPLSDLKEIGQSSLDDFTQSEEEE